MQVYGIFYIKHGFFVSPALTIFCPWGLTSRTEY